MKERKEFSLLNPKPNLEKFAFYLLIFLLPSQFGKHFWPPFSLIYGIRVDYLSPTLYTTDLLILILFLFWCQREDFRKFFLKRHSALIFFVYLLLTVILSSNQALGLYGFGKVIEMFFLGIYVSENIKTKKELARIASIFALAIFTQSLLGIAQYLSQGSINGLLYFFGERKFTADTPGIANASINGGLILRPYGTFSHPNALAGFLLCSLIFVFVWLEGKRDIKKKAMKIVVLLLGSLTLFLTLSRASIILWLILISVLIISKIAMQAKIQKIASTTALVIVATILAFLTPAFSRLESTSLVEEALTQRVELLKNTMSIITSSPLFGVGLHNFLPNLARFQKPLSPTLYLQPVHNIFLLVTAEIGLIGLSFFLWFLFKTYKHLRSSPAPTRKTLSILLVSILVLGLFDHYWLTLQQGQLLFAFVLGICWAL